MKSMPASSARCANARVSSHEAPHRSVTIVGHRPDEQLAPNNPIFNLLSLYIARRPAGEPSSGRAATRASSLFMPSNHRTRGGDYTKAHNHDHVADTDYRFRY